MLNAFRQIGISLGSAIIGAVLISTILVRLEGSLASGVAFGAAFALLGFAVSMFLPLRPSEHTQ